MRPLCLWLILSTSDNRCCQAGCRGDKERKDRAHMNWQSSLTVAAIDCSGPPEKGGANVHGPANQESWALHSLISAVESCGKVCHRLTPHPTDVHLHNLIFFYSAPSRFLFSICTFFRLYWQWTNFVRPIWNGSCVIQLTFVLRDNLPLLGWSIKRLCRESIFFREGWEILRILSVLFCSCWCN